MRRGLMSWSREEMPVAVLEARTRRLQDAMRRDGLGLVLMYTSFATPAAVHWVSNFTPYWSEALLALLPEGQPTLLAALTPRVHPWMREVSHVGEVVSAPRLGAAAVNLIAEKLPAQARIGIVGLDECPASLMQALAPLGERLVDASGWFAALRQPADAAEAGLARRATALASDALQAVPADARLASQVIAAIEGSARTNGAEEVLVRIAPDLRRGATLQRMEGDATLGPQQAVEVSLAYKGVWVRVGRSTGARPPASWAEAQAWFDGAVAGLARNGEMPAWASAPGSVTGWTLEACTGVHPLSVIASQAQAAPTLALQAGMPVVLSVQLALADGPWRASAPAVLGAASQAQQPLGA
jgi:hypothetical protein